ncbi:MAG TPA: prepilin-type N-terminal cleavage/methylation domain-containing protein [Candidatus Binataceae bacterium]|nr:prepilin-type N-terminal cleavage/methylation domain-containing protein [Candidatus Binataceae bacterium]
MAIRTANLRTPARGFTLLELAVVLFVIGLIMAIAMPYFGGVKSAELRSEARRLASRASYLYEEAGAQKVLLRLTFDLNNNSYFVTRLDPFALRPAFMPETGPAGGRSLMPEGVHIRDVWVEGAGSSKRGLASCQFYPSGAADAAVIHLASDRGAVMTLAINPFNGRVAIVSGDFSPSAIAQMDDR